MVLRETDPTPSLTQQREPPAGHVGEGEGARPQYLAGFSPPGSAMPRLAPRAWNPSLCLGFQASGQAAHWAQSMGCTLVPPPSAPGLLYPSPGFVQGSGDLAWWGGDTPSPDHCHHHQITATISRSPPPSPDHRHHRQITSTIARSPAPSPDHRRHCDQNPQYYYGHCSHKHGL